MRSRWGKSRPNPPQSTGVKKSPPHLGRIPPRRIEQRHLHPSCAAAPLSSTHNVAPPPLTLASKLLHHTLYRRPPAPPHTSSAEAVSTVPLFHTPSLLATTPLRPSFSYQCQLPPLRPSTLIAASSPSVAGCSLSEISPNYLRMISNLEFQT